MRRSYLGYPDDSYAICCTTLSVAETLNTELYAGNAISVLTQPHGRLISTEWHWADVLSAKEETSSFCNMSSYVPSESEYEKFIAIHAKDRYGNEISDKLFYSSLPVLYIDTDGGVPISSKTEAVSADMRLLGNSDLSAQYIGRIEIHGRGSSSWDFPTQKSYKIKLDKKTDVYGFGSNKHWVLISNFRDSTLTRNKRASDDAKQLGILGMDMHPVTVVLNGTCLGVYMFGEQIRVAPERVDIFDWEKESEDRGYSDEDLSWIDSTTSVDVDGGWLFELDTNFDEVSRFYTTRNLNVNVNRPEYAKTSDRMFAAMQQYLNIVEGCYNSKDEGLMLKNFVELSSAVPYIMLNMCLGNIDFGGRSRYCYRKHGGKLEYSPVWDLDISQCAVFNEDTTTGWVYYPSKNSQDFAGHMLRYRWFRDLARECYQNDIRPLLTADITRYATEKAELSSAGMMNAVARRTNDYYPSWDPSVHYVLRSYDEDWNLMSAFSVARLAWLDSVLSSDDAFRNSLSGHIPDAVSCEYGTVHKDCIYDFCESIEDSKYAGELVSAAYCPNATEIVDYAFDTCENMTSISADNAESIGMYGFEYCASIEQASFPKCREIGEGAFYECTNMTVASFPSCQTIGSYAFMECFSLATASFPVCTTISEMAFYNCFLLQSANFPSCTSIASQAFSECTGMTTANFPVCTTISERAFYSCASLTTASFPACTTIDSYAFFQCRKLTSASFPTCMTIGQYAFVCCYSLTTVSFPACTTIGAQAFYYCASLTTVSFPACNTIVTRAFERCSAMTTISLPSCTTIAALAFLSCYNLKSLYLTGSSVCSLGASTAFNSTPIGGYSDIASCFGSIYIPSSLLTTYQNATNWTYFSSRFVGI